MVKRFNKEKLFQKVLNVVLTFFLVLTSLNLQYLPIIAEDGVDNGSGTTTTDVADPGANDNQDTNDEGEGSGEGEQNSEDQQQEQDENQEEEQAEEDSQIDIIDHPELLDVDEFVFEFESEEFDDKTVKEHNLIEELSSYYQTNNKNSYDPILGFDISMKKKVIIYPGGLTEEEYYASISEKDVEQQEDNVACNECSIDQEFIDEQSVDKTEPSTSEDQQSDDENAEEDYEITYEDIEFENPVTVKITSLQFEDIYNALTSSAEDEREIVLLHFLEDGVNFEEIPYTVEENEIVVEIENGENETIKNGYVVTFENNSFSPYIFAYKEELPEEERFELTKESPNSKLLKDSQLLFETKDMAKAPLALSSKDPTLLKSPSNNSLGDGYNHSQGLGWSTEQPNFQAKTADGITVEELSIKWRVRYGNTAKEQNWYGTYALPLTGTDNDNVPWHKFQINYKLTGKGKVNAGDIEIIIPAYIWKTRTSDNNELGREAGLLNLSTKGFEWKRVDDNIVITNTSTIPATTAGFIQGIFFMTSPNIDADPTEFTTTYAHELRDVDTKDKTLPYAYGSDDMFAIMNVKTPDNGEIISVESNHINATINTNAELTYFNKTAKSGTKYFWFQTSGDATGIPQSLLPANPKDYYYVRWHMEVQAAGNQAFRLVVNDALARVTDTSGNPVSVQTMLLGASSGTKSWTPTGNNSISITVIDGYDVQRRSFSVWSAYKKADLDRLASGEYVIKNDATAYVEGIDDKIRTTKNSSYSFNIKDWHIRKEWLDNNNEKNYRPSSIDVRFINGWNYTSLTATLSQANNWHAIVWDPDIEMAEESNLGGRFNERTVDYSDRTCTIWEAYRHIDRTHYIRRDSEHYNASTRTFTFKNKIFTFEECKPKIRLALGGYSAAKRRQKYIYPDLYDTHDRVLKELMYGQEAILPYSLSAGGTIATLTLPEGVDFSYDINDYCKRNVTIEIEDNEVVARGLDLTKDDYEIAYVTLSRAPKGMYRQLNPYTSYETYTVGYASVDLLCKKKASDNWERYATVDENNQITTFKEGVTVDSSNTVYLPEGIYYVKEVSTANTMTFSLGYEIGIRIIPTPKIQQLITEKLQNADWIVEGVTNYGVVRYYQDNKLYYSHQYGDTDYIHGRNIRVAVDLEKQVYNGINDRANYRLGFTNRINLWQLTNDTSIDELRFSQQIGEVDFSEGGMFYDLLPAGMTVDEESIKVSKGTINYYEIIDNYKGTGRQLLKVKVDIEENLIGVDSYAAYKRSNFYIYSQEVSEGQPSGHAYSSYLIPRGGMSYICNSTELTFNMWYTYEEAYNRGFWRIYNYSAYEADEEPFGSLRYWTGEADRPAGDHFKTRSQVREADAKVALTDLNPAHNKKTFVYASGPIWDRIWVNSGLFSLYKLGQITGDGDVWRPGYDNDLIVGEGGRYRYSLNYISGDETETSGIIILDTLDSFNPLKITADYDSWRVQWRKDDLVSQDEFDKEREIAISNGATPPQATPVDSHYWKGTLSSVDVSEIAYKGCNPVVYYSFETVNLAKLSDQIGLDDATDKNAVWNNYLQVDNDNRWYKENEFPAGKTMADVKSIAIDCRKDKFGEDYMLPPQDGLFAYINMIAPTAKDDPQAFGSNYLNPLNNKFAYNESYAYGIGTDNAGSTLTEYNHSQYTKVGIVGYDLPVKKTWDDLDDNDGKRPTGSITLELLKTENNVTSVVSTATLLPDEQGNWEGVFEHVQLYDEYGNLNQFTVREQLVDGYESTFKWRENSYVEVINKHEPERIDIPFEKRWTSRYANEYNEMLEVRPRSIVVSLYADGVFTGDQIVVREGINGKWEGGFTDLLKYNKGREVEYTLKEDEFSDDFNLQITTEIQDGKEVQILTNEYYKYGDLKILKKVTGAENTPDALNKDFTFSFILEDKNGNSVIDFYRYTKHLRNGTTETGYITNGDRFTLKADEYIVVHEIETKYYYSVKETQLPGFTLIDIVNASGSVKSGETNEARFTNKYYARGTVTISATKYLTGAPLRGFIFKYTLRDENGALIRQVSNSAGELDPNRNYYDLNSGEVNIGGITFTQLDLGKTYTYYLEEYNNHMSGYSYDESKYKIEITPFDTGIGILSFEKTYYRLNTETGAYEPINDIEFNNTYEAKGENFLTVYKDFHNRELQDQEFEFELLVVDENNNLVPVTLEYRYEDGVWKDSFDDVVTAPDDNAVDSNGRKYSDYIANTDDPTSVTFTKYYRAKNDADGAVLFDHIKYDTKDLEKTYYYIVREIYGQEAIVDYDTEIYGFSVHVIDNKNGTISFKEQLIDTKDMILNVGTDAGSAPASQGYSFKNISFEYDTNDNKSVSLQLYKDGTLYLPDSMIFNNINIKATVGGKNIDFTYPYQIEVNQSDFTYSDGKYVMNLVDEQWDKLLFNLYKKAESVPKSVNDVYNTGQLVTYHSTRTDVANLLLNNATISFNLFIDGERVKDTISSEVLSVASANYGFKHSAIFNNTYQEQLNPSWAEQTGESPVFVNDLKDGSLIVRKKVSNPEVANPDQVFNFKIKLIGENIDGKIFDINLHDHELTYATIDRDSWLSLGITVGSSYNIIKNTTLTLDQVEALQANNKGYRTKSQYYDIRFTYHPGDGKTYCLCPAGVDLESYRARYEAERDEYYILYNIEFAPFDEVEIWTGDESSFWLLSNYEFITLRGYKLSYLYYWKDRNTNQWYWWTDDDTFNIYTLTQYSEYYSIPLLDALGVPLLTYGIERNYTLEKAQVEAIPNVFEVDDKTTDRVIYAWSDPNAQKWYWWSDADVVYYPENSSGFYENYANYINVTGDGLNTSKIKNASYMFAGVSGDIEFGEFESKQITDMSHMFEGCKTRELDLSTFDTSNVVDMTDMFTGATTNYVVLPGIKPNDNSNFFKGNNIADRSAQALLPGSLWRQDGSNPIIQRTPTYLRDNYNYEVDNGRWTRETIYVVEVTNGATNSQLTKNSLLFYSATDYDACLISDSHYFDGCNVYEIDGSQGFNSPLSAPWHHSGKNYDITSVKIMSGDIYPSSIKHWFASLPSVKEWNLSTLHTEYTTDMTGAFSDSSNDHYNSYVDNIALDLSYWDVSEVTNMSQMFNGFGKRARLNLRGWDTSKVKNMAEMFNGDEKHNENGIAEITGISGFNTSEVVNMQGMFQSTRLTSLDLSNWDVSNVSVMERMFAEARNLTSLDVSGWDTYSVTSMYRMFAGCNELTNITGVDGFNTFNVADMSHMFANTSKLPSLEFVENFDVHNVNDFSYMFASYYWSNPPRYGEDENEDRKANYVYDLTKGFQSPLVRNIDLSSWDTSKAEAMDGMFANFRGTISNISNFDVSRLVSAISMFYSAGVESLDLSNWNTVSLKSASSMFYSRYIKNLNLKSFDTSQLYWSPKDTSYMFYSDTIESITLGEKFIFNDFYRMSLGSDVSMVNKDKQVFSTLGGIPGLHNSDPSRYAGTWVRGGLIYKINGSTLELYGSQYSINNEGTGDGFYSTTGYSGSNVPWYNNRNNITKVKIMDEDIDFVSTRYLFAYLPNVTEFDFTKINTSNVTDMSYTFRGTKLGNNALNISNWDMSKVTNTTEMFAQLQASSIIFPSEFRYTGGAIFGSGNLQSLDVSSFVVPGRSLRSMFQNLTVNTITGLDTLLNNNVINNMSYMFSNCKITGASPTFTNTASVSDMSYMFAYADIPNLDLSSLDTSNVETMQGMFASSKMTTIDLSSFVYNYDTSTEIYDWYWDDYLYFGLNMKYMFNYCQAEVIDMRSFDPSQSAEKPLVNEMFTNSKNLHTIYASTEWANYIDTYYDEEYYDNKYGMFEYCSSLPGYTSSKVHHGYAKFKDAGYLTNISTISNDLYSKNIIVNEVQKDNAFVSLLKSLNLINVISADTGDLVAYGEFDGVNWQIIELADGSNQLQIGVPNQTQTFTVTRSDVWPWYYYRHDFDSVAFVGNVIGQGPMDEMFALCGAKTYNLTNFNTLNVNSMVAMFRSSKAETIIFGDTFNTSNVLDMTQMFADVKVDYLDLSSFNTSKVSNFTNMFVNSTVQRITFGSQFKFAGNNLDVDYRLLLPTPSGTGYTGKWIKDDYSAGPFTPIELKEYFDLNPYIYPGTWIWDAGSYLIKFTGGAGASGSMTDVEVTSSEAYRLPNSSFGKRGFIFDHWVDQYGNEYSANDIIPPLRYDAGDTVTLTAIFRERNSSSTIVNGEGTFTLMDGDYIEIENLPVNTSYQIWEETPDGWTLISQQVFEQNDATGRVLVNDNGSSGVIKPITTSEVIFTNEYNPDRTTIQLNGTKLMDNNAAEQGSFNFKLYRVENNMSETDLNMPTSVQAGGFIQFSGIEFTDIDVGKTFTYRVREVAGNDENIQYDSHYEEIKVTVGKSSAGVLTTTILYDSDGMVFKNYSKPGELRIKKQANTTNANKDDMFTFKVSFKNQNGLPLSSGTAISWYRENSDGNIVTSPTNSNNAGNNSNNNNTPSTNNNIVASGVYKGFAWSIDNEGILHLDTTFENPDLTHDIYTYDGYPWHQYASIIVGVNYGNTSYKENNGLLDALDKLHLVNKINAATGDTIPASGYNEYRGMSWRLVEQSDGSYQLQLGNPEQDEMLISLSTMNEGRWPWHNYREQISSVIVVRKVTAVNSLERIFANMVNVKLIDLTLLDTSNVNSMRNMFRDCQSLTTIAGIKNFNTAMVEDMGAMFKGTLSLKSLDLSSFNTTYVTQMYNMFEECNVEILDLSSFNTTNVRNLEEMFKRCGAELIDIRNFDLSSANNVKNIFQNAKLKQIIIGSHWSFNDPSPMMLPGWTWNDGVMEYTGGQLARFGFSIIPGTYYRGTVAENQPDVFAVFDSSDGSLKFYNDKSHYTLNNRRIDWWLEKSYPNEFSIPWYQYRNQIKSVSVEDNIYPTNTSYWFMGVGGDEGVTFDINKLNTSETTKMKYMFADCKAKSLEIKFNTSKVTDMSEMFRYCTAETLTFGGAFDTKNVLYMTGMFRGSHADTLDLSMFNSESLLWTNGMFHSARAREITFGSQFTTEKVTLMSSMFNRAEARKINGLNYLKTDNVIKMEYMFSENKAYELDLSNFNTSGVNTLAYFLHDAKAQKITISSKYDFNGNNAFGDARFPEPNLEAQGKWIKEDKSIGPMTEEEIYNLYLSSPASVVGTWVYYVPDNFGVVYFDANGGTTSATTLTFDNNNTTFVVPDDSKTTRLNYELLSWNTDINGHGTTYQLNQEVDVSAMLPFSMTLYAQWKADESANRDVIAVFNEQYETLKFYYSDNYTPEAGEVSYNVDLNGYNNPSSVPWFGVKHMISSVEFVDVVVPRSTAYWFKDFGKDGSLVFDFNNLNTIRTTNMSYMFDGCKADVLDIDLRSNNAVNMDYMFANSKAKEINFINLITSDVLTMYSMFKNSNAKTLDLSSFDTVRTESLNQMFMDSKAEKIIIGPNFKADEALTMSQMFENSSARIIEGLENLNTINAKYMNGMFKNSKAPLLNLSNFNTANVVDMSDMFAGSAAYRIILSADFDFAGAGISDVSKKALFVEPPTDITDGKWVKEDNGAGPYTPEQLRDNYNSSMAGAWIWNTNEPIGIIHFIGNGGITTEPDIIVTDGSTITIPGFDNTYLDDDHALASWNSDPQGNGDTYNLKQQVSFDQYPFEINLYAQWKPAEIIGTITYDANGGTTTEPTYQLKEGRSTVVRIAGRNNTYLENHALVSWNTQSDGNGISFDVNSDFDFEQMIPFNITLYAQWEYTNYRNYTVKHWLSNSTNSGYVLRDTVVHHGVDTRLEEGDTTYAPVKTYENYVSPAAQQVTIPADDSLVVDYYYDRETRTITFNGNGASYGNMSEQTIYLGLPFRLEMNQFVKYTDTFNGWNSRADGTGVSYNDQQLMSLSASDYGNASTYTLYAQWTSNSGGIVTPTDGVIYVRAKASEQVVIPELPAGTTYSVEEVDLPKGWDSKKVVYENETGNVTSNNTVVAKVTNEYTANGTVVIEAHKRLLGDTLLADAFTFVLKDKQGNQIGSEVKNQSLDLFDEIVGPNGTTIDNPWYMTGLIEFPEISYTHEDIGKEFKYTIQEIYLNENDSIIYDEHVEEVTVTVEDAGSGVIQATVHYDSDGALFVNEMKTGSLKLTKNIVNATNAAKDVQHEFTINLYDSNNKVINDEFTANVYSLVDNVTTTNEDLSIASYTSNYDADGNASSSYSNTSSVVNENITLGYIDEVSDGTTTTRRYIENASISINYDLDGGDTIRVITPEEEILLGVSNTSGSLVRSFSGGNEVTITLERGTDPRSNDKNGFYAVVSGTQVVEVRKTVDVETRTLGSDRKISLKGNQYLVIEDLPHGALYEISESSNPGWVNTSSVNPNGSIVSNQQAVSSFTNTYSSLGSIDLDVKKLFNGGNLSQDHFTFELYDSSMSVLQRQTTDDYGNVVFSLDYRTVDDGNTYVYYIKEIHDDRADLIYDNHTERFTVKVEDNGYGKLNMTVEKDADGLVFENVFDGYDMVVRKDADGDISQNEDFKFRITFYEPLKQDQTTLIDLNDADQIQDMLDRIKNNDPTLLTYAGNRSYTYEEGTWVDSNGNRNVTIPDDATAQIYGATTRYADADDLSKANTSIVWELNDVEYSYQNAHWKDDRGIRNVNIPNNATAQVDDGAGGLITIKYETATLQQRNDHTLTWHTTNSIGVGDVDYMIYTKTLDVVRTSDGNFTHEVNHTTGHIYVNNGVSELFTLKDGEGILFQEIKEKVFYKVEEIDVATGSVVYVNHIGLVDTSTDMTFNTPIDVRFADRLSGSDSVNEVCAVNLDNIKDEIVYVNTITAVGLQADSITIISKLNENLTVLNPEQIKDNARIYLAGMVVDNDQYTASYDDQTNEIRFVVPITEYLKSILELDTKKSGIIEYVDSQGQHRALAHNLEIIYAAKFIDQPKLETYIEQDGGQFVAKLPIASTYELTLHDLGNNSYVYTRSSSDAYVVVQSDSFKYAIPKVYKAIEFNDMISNHVMVDGFDAGKEFYYLLKTVIPEGCDSYIISDSVSDILPIVYDANGAEVTVDGKSNIANVVLSGGGKSFSVTLDSEILQKYAGSELSVKVKARLGQASTSDDYVPIKNNDIYELENQATCAIVLQGNTYYKKSDKAILSWGEIHKCDDVVEVFNYRFPSNVDLRIVKVNEDNVRLAGAVFSVNKLSLQANNGQYLINDNTNYENEYMFVVENGKAVSDQNSNVIVFKTQSNGVGHALLKDKGWYEMNEVSAPSGYRAMDGRYYVYVDDYDTNTSSYTIDRSKWTVKVYYDDYTGTDLRSFDDIRDNLVELDIIDGNDPNEQDDVIKGYPWYKVSNRNTSQLILRKTARGFEEEDIYSFDFRVALYENDQVISDPQKLETYNAHVSEEIRDDNGNILFNATYPVVFKNDGLDDYYYDNMNYYVRPYQSYSWRRVIDYDEINKLNNEYDSYLDKPADFFDADGYHYIGLDNNQTYSIKGLPQDVTYKFEEKDSSGNYVTAGKGSSENAVWSIVSRNAYGQLGNRAGSDHLSLIDYPQDSIVSFVHFFNIKEKMYKVDYYRQDPHYTLPGAEFELIKLNLDNNIYKNSNDTTIIKMGNQGYYNFDAFDFTNDAWYVLKETKAANGYNLPANDWFIKIDTNDLKQNTVHATYVEYYVATKDEYYDVNSGSLLDSGQASQVNPNTDNYMGDDGNGHSVYYNSNLDIYYYVVTATNYYYYGGIKDDQKLTDEDAAKVSVNDVLIDSVNNTYRTVNGFSYYKDGADYYYYNDYRDYPKQRKEVLSDEDLALIDIDSDQIVEKNYLFKPDLKLFTVYEIEEYSNQTVGENQIVVYDSKADRNILYTLQEETNSRVNYDDKAGYLIPNKGIYELPSSGGIGTYIFTLLGSMFMALAVSNFVSKKRKRKRGGAYG